MIREPLFWSLALGACLGGNGTLIGASANVVVCQIARKNRYPVTFWQFTKYGFPLMILSVILASVYIWLRYIQFR
ncbi:putative transporter [bioreactor metagenome]|uniref:Putative transporter n=1 Tax=bioreactor metagenome TaxID=1076179 RepID=A0A645JFE4_9ZZZZ